MDLAHILFWVGVAALALIINAVLQPRKIPIVYDAEGNLISESKGLDMTDIKMELEVPPPQPISCFIKGIVASMRDTPQKWFMDALGDEMICHADTLTWVTRVLHTCRTHHSCETTVTFRITQNGIHLHDLNLAEDDELNKVFTPLFNKLHHLKRLEKEEHDKQDLIRREKMRKEFEVIGCPPNGNE